MKIKIFLPFLIFLNLNIYCQVINIEGLRFRNNQEGWTGNNDLYFSLDQNTQLVLKIENRINTQYKKGKNTILLLGNINYSSTAEQRLLNDGYLHIRYSKQANEKFFTWEMFEQIQYNQFQKLNYRNLTGGGLRLNLIEKDSLNFIFGTSLMFEYEQEREIDPITSNLRLNNYLAATFYVNRRLYIHTIIYYQPLHLDFNDFRFSANGILSLGLTNKLSLVNELSAYYDAIPALGVPNLTYRIKTGLRFKF